LEKEKGISLSLSSSSFLKQHGKKKYGEVRRVGRKPCYVLALCNGKWLKVVLNQVDYFFLFVLTSKKVGKVVPS
jgi:hypothetical protein